MKIEMKTNNSAYEDILSVCSGLRKVPEDTPEEQAYNNALGDVFDYIIKNKEDYLMPGTVVGGRWLRKPSKDVIDTKKAAITMEPDIYVFPKDVLHKKVTAHMPLSEMMEGMIYECAPYDGTGNSNLIMVRDGYVYWQDVVRGFNPTLSKFRLGYIREKGNELIEIIKQKYKYSGLFLEDVVRIETIYDIQNFVMIYDFLLAMKLIPQFKWPDYECLDWKMIWEL